MAEHDGGNLQQEPAMSMLEPLPYRLRFDERRGIGPWDPSYFKRGPTDDEIRQDMAEAEAVKAAIVEAARQREAQAQQRAAELRKAEMQARAGHPIAEIERLLVRVGHDPQARQQVLRILEELEPDDPRAKHYRKELSKRLF